MINGRQKVAREQWRTLDWALRDCDLARELGVTRSRVGQVRYRLFGMKGKPYATESAR